MNNSQKLKQRIITASTLAPIVILGIFFLPPWAFLLISAIILIYGGWEWSNLVDFTQRWQRGCYVFALTIIFFISYFIPIAIVLWLAFGWWIFAALLVKTYPNSVRWWAMGWLYRSVMGILVLTPCWIALNLVRHHSWGPELLFFAFFLVWSADTGAFIVGRKWGKHKLAPNVSPGKTVEGLLGGLIFTLGFAIVGGLLFKLNTPLQWFGLIIFAIAVAIAAVIGDLFESMMKRLVGVKDSGVLLPGHGGLLDRIDSLTAAMPIFALAVLLFF